MLAMAIQLSTVFSNDFVTAVGFVVPPEVVCNKKTLTPGVAERDAGARNLVR